MGIWSEKVEKIFIKNRKMLQKNKKHRILAEEIGVYESAILWDLRIPDSFDCEKERCPESIATDVAEKAKKCKSLHLCEPNILMHIPQKDR
ncbi:MAG: hypothetical protein V8Q05_03890 [Lachnospiraceae bacterium]